MDTVVVFHRFQREVKRNGFKEEPFPYFVAFLTMIIEHGHSKLFGAVFIMLLIEKYQQNIYPTNLCHMQIYICHFRKRMYCCLLEHLASSPSCRFLSSLSLVLTK